MIRPSFIKSLNEEELTLWDKIKEFLFFSLIPSDIRKCLRFLKRLLRWFPVLWKQEEWDYAYIYDILEMKMKELRQEISRDTWHTKETVERALKQITICLIRLDRWRNWEKYYDYPTDDIKFLKNKDGLYEMKYFSKINEVQRNGAHDFEKKNYDKFWKDFLKWHQNWWT